MQKCEEYIALPNGSHDLANMLEMLNTCFFSLESITRIDCINVVKNRNVNIGIWSSVL